MHMEHFVLTAVESEKRGIEVGARFDQQFERMMSAVCDHPERIAGFAGFGLGVDRRR
jgi:hypothetical protein